MCIYVIYDALQMPYSNNTTVLNQELKKCHSFASLPLKMLYPPEDTLKYRI